METIFLKLLNMSISAGWLVLAVVVLRLLLKGAPKAVRCVLWGLVAVRLICPFSVESVLSLIPRTQAASQETLSNGVVTLETGVPVLNQAVSPSVSEPLTPLFESRISPAQVAAWVWVVGMVALLVYTLASYHRLCRRVREAVVWQGNVWLCDRIATPFILGLLHPRIFLPSAMDEADREYVIAHEQAHLKRRDHWVKPLGFLLLIVYWFNPLMWVAYILLCRDIELACDEKVIRQLGAACKKPYADALINCSVPRRAIAACPLAFGEVGVRARIKSVLNYKKPAFWLVLVAIVACVAVALCFLTDPKSENPADNTPAGVTFVDGGSELPGVSIAVTDLDLTGVSPYIEITWKNEREDTVSFGEPFAIYRQENGKWVDCWRGEDRVWTMPAYLIFPNGENTKQYSLTGLDMSAAGRYRFVSDCDIWGEGPDAEGNYENYDVWVEFTLEEGIVTSDRFFQRAESVYQYDGFSFVPETGNEVFYRAADDLILWEKRGENDWKRIYAVEEITLNEANFDSRFVNEGTWTALSLEKLKADNKRAWEGKIQTRGMEEFFLLLEQQDGSVYLAYGHYDLKNELVTNNDASLIRWVHRLEEIHEDGIPYVNGTGILFAAPTKEGDTAVVARNGTVPEEEMTALLSMLKKQKWVSDAFVDRVQFSFDGKIYYDGWIYFGYEQRVVYYDGYFCEPSESDMQCIRDVEDALVEPLIAE